MMPSQTRLRLIDLFRLVCVFYIVIFHAWMIFFGDSHAEGSGIFLFEFVERNFPWLSYHSGLFIVAISFFLFGFNEKRLPFWRWPLFLVGIGITQFNGEEGLSVFQISSWKWGVFSFLMVGYLLLWLSQKMRSRPQLAFLFSFSFLFFLQTYQISALYTDETPSILKQALTGDLIAPKMWTGWFLIPWIAYPLFFAGLGLVAKKYLTWFRKFRLSLDVFLPALFIVSLLNYISSNPPLNVGPEFDAGIFHKDIFDILPILLYPTLIFRYALLEKTEWLLRGKAFQWISSLSWNRHFWICYLIHLILLFTALISPWNEFFRQSPAIEIIILFAYLLPETYARVFVRSGSIWKSWFLKWKQA